MFEADAAADKLFAKCRSNYHGNIPSDFLDTRSYRIRFVGIGAAMAALAQGAASGASSEDRISKEREG
jgi:hypothetical protein